MFLQPDLPKTEPQVFLQQLRQGTAPQHEALERNPYSVMLMGPDLSMPDYLRILQRFYGFVLPMEKQVYPSLGAILGGTDRFKRAHLLREDLLYLGMTEAAVDGLPVLPFLPATPTTAEAFGAMYVLEGSKLGGRQISRHVGSVLGLTAEEGLRFFSGHGAETGAYWQEFRQALADFALTGNQREDIISSAMRTFDVFKNWLEAGAACE